MVATIEHYQSSIKFITKERLHQITKSYTFVGYRTLTNPIMEQTDAEIIGRINASQVVAFIFSASSEDRFGDFLQLVGTEEVHEEGIPLRQIKR